MTFEKIFWMSEDSKDDLQIVAIMIKPKAYVLVVAWWILDNGLNQ